MGGSRSRGEGLTVILSLLSLRTLGGAGVFALAQAGSSPRPLLFLVARRGRERRGHYPTSTQSLRARAGPGRLAGFGEFKSFIPGHAGERRSELRSLTMAGSATRDSGLGSVLWTCRGNSPI